MRPLVIVPTFNERDNLPVIVAALLSLDDLRVLVVDDGSPDGTGAVADTLVAANRRRVSVVHRTGTRGLGLSYIDGMQ
jgi:dolichol-phosphate mannosyltransferase